MSSSTTISIVIPAYNEAVGLRHAMLSVTNIVTTYISNQDMKFEIILIDDGSTDHTWQIIENLSAELHEIRGIRLSRNFGKEHAICAGLDEALGDAVILMDADMQHPPELLPDMIERWKSKNCDIIECVKSSRGKESITSRIFAQTFYKLMSNLSGFDLSGASDYKLLDRKVVDAWKSLGERNVFFRGMSAWLGFQKEKVEFDVSERAFGEGKWSKKALIGLALKGVTAFSSTPLRIISISGLLFFVFAIIMASNTLFQYIQGYAVTGFSTVILLLLITSSLIMLALGIIGEYLARIYEEVKARPRYIISHKTKSLEPQ